MAVFEIPLTAEPQTFNIRLGDVQYGINVYWNALTLSFIQILLEADDFATLPFTSSSWVFDILAADGAVLVAGIPLVTGRDLLAQYAYLGVRGSLVVQTAGDVDAVPTFKNLGESGRCFFVTQD